MSETNDKLKVALEGLKAQGVRNVRVEFSGEGDDGGIQDVEYTNAEGENIKVADSHEELFYEYLDANVTIDWINNEGGGGNLLIDLKGDKAKLVLSSYYNERREVEQPVVKETL